MLCAQVLSKAVTECLSGSCSSREVMHRCTDCRKGLASATEQQAMNTKPSPRQSDMSEPGPCEHLSGKPLNPKLVSCACLEVGLSSQSNTVSEKLESQWYLEPDAFPL